MAKTLNGALIPYGPTRPADNVTADGALFYKTPVVTNAGSFIVGESYTITTVGTTNFTAIGAVANVPGTQFIASGVGTGTGVATSTSGLFLYGFVQDANQGSFGNQVTQGWSRALGTISLSGLSGVLPVLSGGTGNTVIVPGAVAYGTASALQYTAVGTAGQVLLSGGAGAPTWANQNTLNVNSASVAATAGALSPGATIAISGGATAAGVLFTGASAISLSVSSLNAPSLSGIVPSANLSGTYAINISGNAATATSANFANSATTASTATTLQTARNITLTGGATGSASFNGSADANITVTVQNVQGYAPNSGAVANTLALRDPSGYLFAQYLNQASANSEGGTISQIMFTNGTDNFLRKASLAQVTSAIGGSFVAKSGDTMTGTLAMSGIASNITLGPGTTLFNSAAGGLFQINGAVVATGELRSTTGPVNAYAGSIAAGNPGTTGYARLTPGTGALTGYIEFIAWQNTRSGYIGYSSTAGSTDTGTLNYVAGLHNFNGSIQSTGNVTAYSSDGRLKKNITVIENAVQKVLSLGGYSYDWDTVKCLEVGFKPANEHEHGLIAQEVVKVMPDAVAAAPFNDKYLTVRYERIVALLVAAMGEQQKELEELRTRLDRVEKMG